MVDIIVAGCQFEKNKFGIGYQNKLPWYIPEELSFFRQKTMNSILIIGRKTAEFLPPLKDRIIFIISRTLSPIPGRFIFKDVESAIETGRKMYPNKKIFIAGGSLIYTDCLENVNINKIYLSIIKKQYLCDSFVKIGNEWVIVESQEKGEFISLVLEKNPDEKQYLDLLQDVLEKGKERQGRNGKTKSLFCRHLCFDLTKGFPLLSTKKMFFKGVVEELLFFLRGDTNSKLLEDKGVNIWKSNTQREFLDSIDMKERPVGIMGPMYGFQWRHFNAQYDEITGTATSPGVDQLSYVLKTIKKEKYSRRIIMTDYNPCQAKSGVLFPCHSIAIQFYIEDEFIDMFCYNRSQDLFLGVPFNIASSALFLMIVAKVSGLIPRFLNMTLGDVHIYEEHYAVAGEQLKRRPYSLGKVEIDIKKADLVEEVIKNIENMNFQSFSLSGYQSYPNFNVKMVA